LVTDKETKVLNSVVGISHTHPFIVFDYKSKRLIQKNEKHEIPGCDVWIVSKETRILSRRFILKKIDNWWKLEWVYCKSNRTQEYRAIVHCDNENKYKIPNTAKSICLKPQIYGS